jgi:hypothetical protein
MLDYDCDLERVLKIVSMVVLGATGFASAVVRLTVCSVSGPIWQRLALHLGELESLQLSRTQGLAQRALAEPVAPKFQIRFLLATLWINYV